MVIKGLWLHAKATCIWVFNSFFCDSYYNFIFSLTALTFTLCHFYYFLFSSSPLFLLPLGRMFTASNDYPNLAVHEGLKYIGAQRSKLVNRNKIFPDVWLILIRCFTLKGFIRYLKGFTIQRYIFTSRNSLLYLGIYSI